MISPDQIAVANPTKPIRVVIIESRRMLRDLIGVATLAATPKLQVAAAVGSVSGAVAACLEHKPALAISDWFLPDGTASAILEKVRLRLPQLRFIIVTASEDTNVVHEAVAARVHGFLFLRDSVETLYEAISAVLQGQSYFCAGGCELLQRDRSPSAAALTSRERAILRGIADGLGIKEIATHRGVSSATIRKELIALKQKLGIYETVELVRKAVKIGLVDSVPPRPDALWTPISSAG